MKKIFVVSILLLSFFTANISSAQTLNRQLKSLLDSSEYFQFEHQFEKDSASLDEFNKYYFGAFYENLFGSPKKSDEKIYELGNLFSENLNDSMNERICELFIENDLRQFIYEDARNVSQTILNRYASLISKSDSIDLRNNIQVFTALKNVPPQTMEKNDDMKINFKRDVAGLIKIPVKVNNEDCNYILDTGANFSVLNESEAIRLGVKIIDTAFNVTSSSKAAVASRIGVADKIQIGNVIFHNVVFIIMSDDQLKFVGGLYKIKGIIGLPVIAQLGEVTISNDNTIFSPMTETKSDLHNLAFEGNTPLTELEIFGQKHTYIFDMGAATSVFSSKFKHCYADSLGKTKVINAGVGGAGGVQKVRFEMFKNLHYKMGNAENILKTNMIQESGSDDAFKAYFGIAGEDIFQQWNSLTINFNKNFIELK